MSGWMVYLWLWCSIRCLEDPCPSINCLRLQPKLADLRIAVRNKTRASFCARHQHPYTWMQGHSIGFDNENTTEMTSIIAHRKLPEVSETRNLIKKKKKTELLSFGKIWLVMFLASMVKKLRTSCRPTFTKLPKYCFNTSNGTETTTVPILFRRLKNTVF